MPESRKIIHGNSIYWINILGFYHREDGPAIEYGDGTKQWCLNGVFHRVDGPAIESSDVF